MDPESAVRFRGGRASTSASLHGLELSCLSPCTFDISDGPSLAPTSGLRELGRWLDSLFATALCKGRGVQDDARESVVGRLYLPFFYYKSPTRKGSGGCTWHRYSFA